MKKTIVILLILTVSIFMTACSGENKLDARVGDDIVVCDPSTAAREAKSGSMVIIDDDDNEVRFKDGKPCMVYGKANDY